MRFALALALLAACASHAPPPATPRPSSTTDRAAVLAVLSSQRDAWNRGDLDGYMAGYARTPDLVFTSGGAIRRGWQETHDKYLARYGGQPATMGHLDFEILGVQPVGADGAVVLGRWRVTGGASNGSGVFSVVLERRPEGWRLVHDHTSSNPP